MVETPSNGHSTGEAAGIQPTAKSPERTVRVFGPASLSNLGPGFDTLGLCIDRLGDYLEAWSVDEPGVHLFQDEQALDWITPPDPDRNTASVAARAVLDQLGIEEGMALRIHKGFTPGSGLGSSAASAVAGAWAANVLHGLPLSKEDLVEAVLAGESIASGSRHGDNVLPALFGGLVLVASSDPTRYRRIVVPRSLPIALILPEVQVLTKQARDMLPKEVSLRDAVHNASELAFMLDAYRNGDWETVGTRMMADRIVEPVRARLVPCYDAVRNAALETGAYGCALTGSGPAMFAIAETFETADRVCNAMIDASRAMGIPARGITTRVNTEGVRTVSRKEHVGPFP